MASEASRSGAAADSYIGSLISLTSKSEIRYEGILYNINTDESSIGLRNVRSYGTEGRKKDGPQIPGSDKVYEYILFRGSDIKDLQVKASPPVQTAPTHSDPAIIQYARAASAPTSLPTVGSGTATDLNSHTSQLGLQRSTFQGGLPLHQPGGSLGPWGSPPPPADQNGSGLAMPFYWQGYYTPSGGLPHLQQQTLFHPPPGAPIPHSVQQPLQYPGMSASLPSGTSNFPDFPSSLQPGGSTPNLTSATSLSTLTTSSASSSVPDAAPVLPYKPLVPSFAAPVLGSNLSSVSPLASNLESVGTTSQNMLSVGSSKLSMVPGPTIAYQTSSQSIPSIGSSNGPSQIETSVPLVTPGQLSQPILSTLPSSQPLPSQPLQTSVKAAEVKPPDAKIKPSLQESSEAKGPILPLPTTTDKKLSGAPSHNHITGRGRGRGGGNGYPRPVTKFTEDFDFMAMNEKFKKDEVWGHLGKNKDHLGDREGEEYEADVSLDDDEAESSKLDVKPVYIKEDFFDSLSNNAFDRGTRNGRARFSEQLKVDTETFGEFQRHRLNRGGGRGFRGGGGRMRGSYYNRGYGGYAGRGRGNNFANYAS